MIYGKQHPGSVTNRGFPVAYDMAQRLETH